MKKIISVLKPVLLIAGMMFSWLSYSQENFSPGLVINNSGDTLRGLVDYRNWATNPKAVAFKVEVGSSATTFLPTDIIEFRVEDEIYVSAIVEAENTPVEDSRLEYDSKLRISLDTLFLQTLVDGKKGLYYYRNNEGRENFYIKKDDGFELLIYKKYLIRQGTTSSIRTISNYIGQLNLYFSDCPDILQKVNRASYDQGTLIKLFQEYYKCFSTEITFQRNPETIRFEIGVLAGVSNSKLKFYGAVKNWDFLENSDYKRSTDFSGGVFFDFVMPRRMRKLSLNNELLLFMYQTNGYDEQTNFNNDNIKISTEFTYSYLRLNNLLRYRFPVGNATVFINGGVSNGILLSEEQYLKKEITTSYSGTNIYESNTVLPQTKKFDLGFLAGAGVRLKKLSFEARYEKSDGMVMSSSIGSKVTRYYLLLGYCFR
ncbi:MAG: PorT family protein [Bacteroidales bacterium]|nr:PorT family protein [Bacteroidales bacterium]